MENFNSLIRDWIKGKVIKKEEINHSIIENKQEEFKVKLKEITIKKLIKGWTKDRRRELIKKREITTSQKYNKKNDTGSCKY